MEENPEQPPTMRTAEQIKIEILEEELQYARHRARWMGQRVENAKIDAQLKLKKLEMLGKENMNFDAGLEDPDLEPDFNEPPASIFIR